MKFISTIVCLVFPYFLFSQNIIGNITDNSQNPVSFAGVQLIESQSNKIIFFTQTDREGNFLLKSNASYFPLKIKVSHLSYEPQELTLQSYPKDKLTIRLEARINKLEDVVIEARAYDVIERNDTLKYNLKNLLNGSELKLKDVINKLPGLSVDNDGKIRYMGKTIDNLLLDGDEFYKENHQIAGENITAEMIEKIELLKNYRDFSSIKDFENSQIALNIGLKDDYKDKFKGNAELEGGYDKRYKSHNNLYNFGSKSKFNLIANANNTNYNVISLNDYLSIRNITGKNILQQQSTSGLRSITEKDLPSFLFSTDNIHTKDLKNVTLNFTNKINEKERIEFVSVFNHIKQTENTNSISVFFDNSDSDLQNTESIKGNSAFFSNVFKYENKVNTNSYFRVNSYLFVGNDNQKQNLQTLFVSNQDNIFFDNHLKLNSNKFGVNALYKTKFSDKVLFEGLLFNDYDFSTTTKDLYSSSVFDWFDYNQNRINQETKSDIISFGAQGKATINTNVGTLSLRLQSLSDNEKVKNNNQISQLYNFENSYIRTENTLGAVFSSQLFKQKLRYTAGLDFSNNNHSVSSVFDKSINVILPDISLSYRISNHLNASLGYRSSLGGYSSLNFLSGNIIENYRTELIANNLIPQKLITDTYSSSLSYVDVKKNIFSILSLSHSNGRKNISKTFENNSVFTREQYNFLDLQQSTSLIFTFEKKFYDIPYGLKVSSFTTKTKMGSLINNETSNNTVYQSTNDFGIKSYFKKSGFNFSAGIEYINSISENATSNLIHKSKLEKISPFLNFNGLILNKKVNWSINSNYHIFKSSLVSSNEILDIGFKVIYNHNSKFDLYLHANNILNIRENNTKNSILSNQNFVQETIMNTLSGYVNLGVIYSF
jgi:hypothetical protein